MSTYDNADHSLQMASAPSDATIVNPMESYLLSAESPRSAPLKMWRWATTLGKSAQAV